MAVSGTYYLDCARSRDEMNRLLDAMANGGRISTVNATDAKSDVQAAYDACGGDAAMFWEQLASRISDRRDAYMQWPQVKGKSGLRPAEAYLATVTSGLQAVKSQNATDYANSWGKWWDDVIVQSAADYADAAREAADTVKNPVWLWGVAALVVGLVLLKGK